MAEQLAHLLDRLGRAVHNLQFTDGLNPAQWGALRFISRAKPATCKPSALADYLCTTKGTISQTLKSLEIKGYIRKIAETKDRRVVRLKRHREKTALASALHDTRDVEERGADELKVLHNANATPLLHNEDPLVVWGACQVDWLIESTSRLAPKIQEIRTHSISPANRSPYLNAQ